jgi:hypothetical protein
VSLSFPRAAIASIALSVSCIAAPAAPTAPAAPPAADLDALVRALDVRGSITSDMPQATQAFLDLKPELREHLKISLDDVHAVDPGYQCDVAAPAMLTRERPLGTVATVITICTPDRRSQGVLQLADGRVFMTFCKGPGVGWPTIQLSGEVGEHTGSVTLGIPPNAVAAPSHACTGWRSVPGDAPPTH